MPRRDYVVWVVIGEAVIGLLFPEGHLGLWEVGPWFYQRFMHFLGEHVAVMRIVFVTQITLGLWIAARQLPARAIEPAPQALKQTSSRQKVEGDRKAAPALAETQAP